MARHINPNNTFTTISIRKTDKSMLRTLAEVKKVTKNGHVYEKDADIFSRIILDFIKRYPNMVGDYKPTYPASALDNNPDISRPNSSRVVTI